MEHELKGFRGRKKTREKTYLESGEETVYGKIRTQRQVASSSWSSKSRMGSCFEQDSVQQKQFP